MSKRRVLVTGATGYIASQFVEALRSQYEVTLLDVRSTDAHGNPVSGVTEVNLLEDDLDDLAAYFDGIDTVVHSAFAGPLGGSGKGPRRAYLEERQNVDMTFRVFQLALEAGARRVVCMSTNQATKWYEQPWFDGLIDMVYPDNYPKPISFYGWAKTAYETLGFMYASGSLGRKLENVHLRIVVPRDIDPDLFKDAPPQRYIRELAGYISPRDLEQLVVKCIEAPNIEDEYGVPFHIFYGVSDNTRKFWSITNARKVVGYDPQDDSERRFADDIAEILAKEGG